MSSHSNIKTSRSKKVILGLALGAAGVVYGDIGTSPLYAINEIMFAHGLKLDSNYILQTISLVFWALTIAISIKYIILVLRADSDGEGGVFALYSLLCKFSKRSIILITGLLILAAGLLFGDGIITPAISVISAIEGLQVATNTFQPYVVPLTIAILTVLFAIQFHGTHKVGRIFGPIMIVWFLAISVFGVMQISQHTQILQALNPIYALNFLTHTSIYTVFIVLGSVMLVITGGEALYADMGHFGKLPIRMSWFALTYPALVLNYLGQGAYMLGGNQVVNNNIFYSMMPSVCLYPMIILATLATVIASQALISGAFSLTSQGISLGLLPYLKVKHTHKDHEGQIYISFVNWALYIGCVLLVIFFKTSSNLAAAYGLAVSGVMFTTSIAMIPIARHYWRWSYLRALAVFLPLSIMDLTFIISNSFKFLEGGYIPLSIGAFFLVLMLIWKWGRKQVAKSYKSHKTISVRDLVELEKKTPNLAHLNKSLIIMTPEVIDSLDSKLPLLEQVILDRYGFLSQHLVFLNVNIEKNPHAHENRFQIYSLYENNKQWSITGVQLNFGFMEEANVESVLEELSAKHLIHITENHKNWIVAAMHERIYLDGKPNLAKRLRFHIFKSLSKIASTADQYFGLGCESKLTVEVVPVHFI